MMTTPNNEAIEIDQAVDDLELFEETRTDDEQKSEEPSTVVETEKDQVEMGGMTVIGSCENTVPQGRQRRFSEHLTSILVAPVKFLLPFQQGSDEDDDCFTQRFGSADNHHEPTAKYEPILAMDDDVDDNEDDSPKPHRIMLGYNAYHGPYAKWLPAEIIDNIEHFRNNNPLFRSSTECA